MALIKERTKDVIIDDANVNFDSLFLSPFVLEALKENHFSKPSPIQLKAIPLGKCGLDLIVKSKSGTGKTAVFAIIALEMIDTTKDHLQALILAPTREIAVQSCEVINSLGKHIKDLKVHHFIGGISVKEDTTKLKGCHIAVASPGRMLHLITSGSIDVKNVKLFVLDEADNLMETSFQSDINKIFHSLPKNKQMLAVSATFPNELDVFLSQYMHIPTHVSPQVDTPLLLGLKHFVTITPFNSNVIFLTKFKNAELIRLLGQVSFTQCLVFCRYQTRAEEVSNFLNTNGWKADFISGAQAQKQRLEVLKKLKDFQCRILLTTDLTARGIDAVNVDLVINYDVPNDESTYLHRMGRAGRYGSKGLCVTMAAKGAEVRKFSDIVGSIGGCEMSVPILPKEQLPDNIWEASCEGFERLSGTLKEQGVDESVKVKDDILSTVNEILRDSNKDNEGGNVANEEGKQATKKSNVKLDKTDDNLHNVEDNTHENDDTSDLLALLAAGKSDNASLASQKSTLDKTSIYNKNISLLTVSSLLDDDNFDEDNDQTTKTIESFIATLKEPEVKDKVNGVKDSELINPTNECTRGKTNFLDAQTTEVDIEDVFIHAFNYAVDRTKPHWADLYNFQKNDNSVRASGDKPVNLLQDLLEYVANEENPEMDEYDEEEENEDYEYDYKENYQNEDEVQPSMEWVPVETVERAETRSAHARNEFPSSLSVAPSFKTKRREISVVKDNVQSLETVKNGDQFEELFDSSVEQFHGQFNTLESREEFETMWAVWQRQMNSVRDYVQQNIYLNEMTAYRDVKYQ